MRLGHLYLLLGTQIKLLYHSPDWEIGVLSFLIIIPQRMTPKSLRKIFELQNWQETGKRSTSQRGREKMDMVGTRTQDPE